MSFNATTSYTRRKTSSPLMNQNLDYRNEGSHFSAASDICQSSFHFFGGVFPLTGLRSFSIFSVWTYQVLTRTEVMAHQGILTTTHLPILG